MDAKVGDWVVTPRIGKPVEIQALWINALKIAGGVHRRAGASSSRAAADAFERALLERGRRGCLYDVVDVDHRPGTADADAPAEPDLRRRRPAASRSLDGRARPADRRRRRVAPRTPLGLRSLAPGRARLPRRATSAGPRERDGAYHQGTVWPWLLGPFVDAWVRVRGGTRRRRKREARERFLAPLLAHLDEAGLGHVSEIADADPPHTPRGCPFQAWSLGELLRLDRVVLALPADARHAGRRAASKVRT